MYIENEVVYGGGIIRITQMAKPEFCPPKINYTEKLSCKVTLCPC